MKNSIKKTKTASSFVRNGFFKWFTVGVGVLNAIFEGLPLV
jgi:hypothetical protein